MERITFRLTEDESRRLDSLLEEIRKKEIRFEPVLRKDRMDETGEDAE